MRLSTRSRYAARALIELVKQGGEDKPVMMRKLAEGQSVSKRYLDNIFTSLRVAGLVRATRGAKGGYRLGHGPSSINLLDVVVAMDGDVNLVDCVEPEYHCDFKADCATHAAWGKATLALQEALRKISLQDLADGTLERCPED